MGGNPLVPVPDPTSASDAALLPSSAILSGLCGEWEEEADGSYRDQTVLYIMDWVMCASSSVPAARIAVKYARAYAKVSSTETLGKQYRDTVESFN